MIVGTTQISKTGLVRQVMACLLICGGLFSFLLLSVGSTEAQRAARKQDKDAFALVEFFTSEACLRCRDSSELAAKVVKNSGGPDSRVFLLSFHVDYLNSLSWRDPYSSEAYSERQQEYMLKLRNSAAVPGSFIINGSNFLNTDSEIAMQRAIISARTQKPQAQVQLSAKPIPGEKALQVSYRVAGLGDMRRPFFLLHVAALEPEIKKTVSGGVNDGQAFTHVNVVRNFQTRRLNATGEAQVAGRVELVLPVELDPEDVRVVAFVQDPRTLAVLGAEMLHQVKRE